MKNEISFTITPSNLDIEHFYNYLINNLSFEQVLSLYIMLRIKISTGKDMEKNNER